MSGFHSSHRSHRHHERGAAAVEFAIILPLLVMLVFGVVQFSLAYNRQQGLHAAAREGARLAALGSTTIADIETRVQDSLDGVPFDTTPTTTVTPGGGSGFAPCDGRRGDTVVVEVSGQMVLELPMVASPSVELTGRGEFRCE